MLPKVGKKIIQKVHPIDIAHARHTKKQDKNFLPSLSSDVKKKGLISGYFGEDGYFGVMGSSSNSGIIQFEIG